jgi:hypothetical protein
MREKLWSQESQDLRIHSSWMGGACAKSNWACTKSNKAKTIRMLNRSSRIMAHLRGALGAQASL